MAFNTNQLPTYQPRMLGGSTAESSDIVKSTDKTADGSMHDQLGTEAKNFGGNPYTGGPNTIPGPSAEGVRDEMKVGYSDEAAQEDLQNAYANTGAVANKFTTDAVGNKADPYYQQNQAKNNKMGNLNNKSYDDTLRLSRLADTVNNSLWWTQASDIGNGAVGTSAFTAPELHGLEKREPIETQETRQMRANEEMDAEARKRAVDLQARVFDLTYDSMVQNRDTDNALAKQLGIANIDIYNAMRQAVIDVDYRLPAQTYYQEVLTRFNAQLEMWMLGQKASLLAWVQKNAPSIIHYVAQLCATNPQALSNAYEASYTQNVLAQIDADPTLNPGEKIKVKAYYDEMLKAGIMMSQYNTVKGMFFSNNPQ